MLNFYKLIEIIVSLQLLIISTMIPVFIAIPENYKNIQIIDLPISWQIPLIILFSLIYKRDIVLMAFTIYLFTGLFFLPIFHQGGSLGYILTPNFGYLIGIYPLIIILSNLNNKNIPINLFTFIKTAIFAIITMHLVGIIYTFIQIIYIKKLDIIIYNISKLSLGKIGFHILMLTPITLIIRQINSLRNQK